MLAGCGPRLAQVPYGAEEARWQKILRDNYSGYEAPRTAPPAIRDNVSPRLLEEEEQARRNEQNKNNPPPAADNPPAAVDDPQPAVNNPPPAADNPPPAVDNPPAAVDDPTPAAGPEKPAAPAAAKPAAAPQDSGVYEVRPNDTLGGIAQKFYGDARRRDVIIRANPALKKNPNFLKSGMKLNIPKI